MGCLKAANFMNNEQFLSFFPGYVIQFFDDTKENMMLAKTIPAFDPDYIARKQSQNCGTYFSPNGFTGGRRLIRNLKQINAVFIDADVSKEKEKLSAESIDKLKPAALQSIKDFPLTPHFVIETKNGFQPIWLVENFDSNSFTEVVKYLVNIFKADPGRMDVAGVLRLPNYRHLKNPKKPFLCKLVVDNSVSNFKKYTVNDFIPNYDSSAPTIKIESNAKLTDPRVKSLYKQSVTTSDNILKAKRLPIKWVTEFCAAKAGIQITWQENHNGTFQIIENGEITSGFINPTTNIAYSSSEKSRKGDTVSIAKYYLCNIAKNKANAYELANWLLYAASKQ